MSNNRRSYLAQPVHVNAPIPASGMISDNHTQDGLVITDFGGQSEFDSKHKLLEVERPLFGLHMETIAVKHNGK